MRILDDSQGTMWRYSNACRLLVSAKNQGNKQALSDARKLLDWGVDGLTTDFPDRLASLLRSRGVDY